MNIQDYKDASRKLDAFVKECYEFRRKALAPNRIRADVALWREASANFKEYTEQEIVATIFKINPYHPLF